MKNFQLIETILWEDENYFLLDLHMKRLEKSAKHFSFECDKQEISAALEALQSSFDKYKKYKVRLLLEKSGDFDITSILLECIKEEPAKIVISKKKTDSSDIFLQHKTTNRKLYDSEYEKCRKNGFFDVIFTNQENKITEGAITNILIRSKDVYLTPPLACGLLSGTYREHLLISGDLSLKEKVLKLEDLLNADEIFLINSVRKLVKATLAS